MIEREFEDVAAVVDSFSEPANLMGHSYGGLCALEGALLSRNVHKLILYEPSISINTKFYDPATVNRLEALLQSGDREGLLTTFMREAVKVSAKDIELLRSLLAWAGRVAAAHTIPREMRAEQDYRFDPERLRELRAPTLLLVGGDSPPFLRSGNESLKAVLPNAQLAVMPG